MLHGCGRSIGRTPPFGAAGGHDEEPAGRAVVPADSRSLREQMIGMRVLIVEDEALISIELEDIFLLLGLEVVGTAQDAEEAMRIAVAERPDFITMDVNLAGDRDGVSVATAIYERLGLRSVFISAHGDAETVARALPACPLGWLAKPVTQRELAERLPVLLANLDRT